MMHSLAILLFLLLLTSIEARKLTASNGGVFKVDLIHRDSPQSPYYNSSMTLKERLKKSPLGYISRGHNIRLSSTYYNISDAELSDIILQANHGAYLMKLSVGTPKVDFFVIADTGSNLIWVQCSPCESCTSIISQPFDPTKSSTFQAISCETQSCSRSDVITSCPLEVTTESPLCIYEVTYGKGSTSGILATETISLSSSDAATPLSLSSCVFGCGIKQSSIPQDGIAGLGIGPSSLISLLGQTIDYKFSYCLPPLTSGVSGNLAFGADVTSPGAVSTPLANGPSPTKYYLTLNSISIGDDDFPMPLDMNFFVDSGTTLTFLPASIYGSIKSALETAIGLTPTPSTVPTSDLCYNSDQQINPPNVVFHFEGADVVLSKINIFWEIEKGVTCLAMAAASGDSFIFGNIAQINYEVGYDLQAGQVSFAPANCANY